jgi:hypothetical protein
MASGTLKRVSIVGGIAIGAVTILGGLSSAWQMAGRLITAVGRVIGGP